MNCEIWIVAPKRKDGRTPNPKRAIGDRMFHDAAHAEDFRQLLGADADKYGVFPMILRVP